MSEIEVLGDRPSWDVEVQRVERARQATAGWLLGFTSPRTRTEYGSDLRQWQGWCRDVGRVDPLDVERAHVDAWARELEGRYAAASVRRKVAAISSWYSALADVGLIDRNPAARVRRPKVDTRTGTTEPATTSQLGRLLDAADGYSPDAAVMLRLMAELGLRITEACTLRAGDVATTPSGAHLLRVHRKGGWIDTRPMSDDLGRRLDTLARERIGDEGRTLLRAMRGGDLDRNGGRWMLRHLCEIAGIPGEVHPHMIRVWAITTALDTDGVQLHDAQDFAGHANPATTLRYDRARQRRAGVIAGALAAVLDGACTVRGDALEADAGSLPDGACTTRSSGDDW